MEQITIERSGRRPATFMGQLLGDVSGQPTPNATRWHEVSVYLTDTGKYVAHVRFRSNWEGEIPRDDVLVSDSPEGVIEKLKDYEPWFDVIGYPALPQFKSRQESLRKEVELFWGRTVGSLLAQSPDVFAEQIG